MCQLSLQTTNHQPLPESRDWLLQTRGIVVAFGNSPFLRHALADTTFTFAKNYNKTNFFMDTFTAIDFETAFASIFRFWLKPLSIMVCKSLNMKRIAPTVFIRRTFFRCARNTKSHSSTTKH